MTSEKKIDLQSTILTLLEEKNAITLHDVAASTGLSTESATNRRAIQRALSALIKSNIIEAQGSARARVYIKFSRTENKNSFKNIQLSIDGLKLLQKIQQPLHTKIPVGYNPHFLKSYHPKKTPYLNASIRATLFSIGNAEPIIRPAGTYARTILNRLLIDLSWNSSRLEGNTYSLLETKRLIELGEFAEGKNLMEAQMILNHKNAIEYIIDSIDEKKISAHEVCSIHALLSENLLGDQSACGRIRQISVGISGTNYLPLDNPHVLKDCFDIFIEKINLIDNPFEQSFFALVHLSYLQAFEDVNKRTARLVANIPLIKHNLKPLSFIDVDQHDYVLSLLGVYENNDLSLLRDFYAWAYEKSTQRYSALQQTVGEPNLFKLKYRKNIYDIIRKIILDNVPAKQQVNKIKKLIAELELNPEESAQLFQAIEIEIMSLHADNIARFKIRPSEFQRWNRKK